MGSHYDGWNSNYEQYSFDWWNDRTTYGSNRDDTLNGTSRNDRIDGRNGDDVINGGAGNDVLRGGGGEDILDGGAGNDRLEGGRDDDLLLGGSGNDVLRGNGGSDMLLGGDGNDILYGSDSAVGSYSSWLWWLCRPTASSDILDGGAGNDWIFAAGGDDLANYTMAENAGASDYYDGGTGDDTLQLTLTSAEFNSASVQRDIARFEAFLDRYGNEWRDSGPTFHFSSFDLDVRNFERLEIVLTDEQPDNAAPVGAGDTFTLLEDSGSFTGNVLANDSDADGDALQAVLVSAPASVTLAADGSFTFTPDAEFNGVVSFTYKVYDGEAFSDETVVTLNVGAVNDAPSAIDDTASVQEDGTVLIDVLGNDTAGPANESAQVLTVTGATALHGIVTVLEDGTLSYKPNGDYFGTDTITYTVSDNVAGDARSATATVAVAIAAVNDAPVAGDDAAIVEEDGSVVIDVLGNDSAGPGEAGQGLSVLHASALNGAVILNDDGTLLYTPNADFFGDDVITYTLLDDGGLEATGTAAVTVTAVNDAPLAVADTLAILEDESVTIDVLANDSAGPGEDGQPLAITSAFALHGTVAINDDGTLSYTPSANYSGDDTITYAMVDEGQVSSGATVAVTIAAVNDAPTTVADAFRIDFGTTSFSASVLMNDSDVENDWIQIASFTEPEHGELTFSDSGAFTYVPEDGFLGTVTFSYVATDGTDTSGPTMVTLTIAVLNQAPVADSDEATTNEDTPVIIDVLANDIAGPESEAGQSLTIIEAFATNGTVTINADGTLTYTPDLNFYGDDIITYTVVDDGMTDGLPDPQTATTEVAVTVKPVNDFPVAVDDAFTVQQGQSVSGNVLANDYDVEGAPLMANLIYSMLPKHGQIAFDSTGLFTYTPDAGFVGEDSFSYQASGGGSSSGLGTVKLTVTADGDAFQFQAAASDPMAQPAQDFDFEQQLLLADTGEAPAPAPDVAGDIGFDFSDTPVQTPDVDLL